MTVFCFVACVLRLVLVSREGVMAFPGFLLCSAPFEMVCIFEMSCSFEMFCPFAMFCRFETFWPFRDVLPFQDVLPFRDVCDVVSDEVACVLCHIFRESRPYLPW